MNESDRHETSETAPALLGATAGARISQGRSWSSLPLDTPAGRQVAARCLTGSTTPLIDATGPVLIRDVLTFPVTINTEGELQRLLRCCLITPDGKIYHTSSPYAVEALGTLVEWLGSPPWTPPLPVELIEVKTRRGYTCHSLVISEGGENDAAKTKPKKA